MSVTCDILSFVPRKAHLHIPSPVGHGWMLDKHRLVVNWISGDPASVAVLELLSSRAAVKGAASCQTTLARICVH